MDNIFITIAVAVMYALMLMASNGGQVSPATPTEQVSPTQGTVIDTGMSRTPSPYPLDTGRLDTWRTPLFQLPDSAVTPDSATADTTK